MKRALILCLFLVINGNSGQCATNLFPPLQPIDGGNSIQNYSSNLANPVNPLENPANSDYSNISQIEQALYNRTFVNQDISVRLSRIEKSLFSTTYSSATSAQRIDNIISNFNQINKYPNISKNVLSGMESKVLNQTYPQNNPERRIERLEQQMLGAIQSGDLNARYEALKIAARAYNKTNQYSANSPTQSGWRGLTQSFSNAFSDGNMTGFTPPINPYPTNFTDLGSMNSDYTSSYTSYNNGNVSPFSRVGSGYNNYNPYANPYANRYGRYRNNGLRNGGSTPSGYGYYDGARSFGSGVGVTILD